MKKREFSEKLILMFSSCLVVWGCGGPEAAPRVDRSQASQIADASSVESSVESSFAKISVQLNTASQTDSDAPLSLVGSGVTGLNVSLEGGVNCWGIQDSPFQVNSGASLKVRKSAVGCGLVINSLVLESSPTVSSEFTTTAPGLAVKKDQTREFKDAEKLIQVTVFQALDTSAENPVIILSAEQALIESNNIVVSEPPPVPTPIPTPVPDIVSTISIGDNADFVSVSLAQLPEISVVSAVRTASVKGASSLGFSLNAIFKCKTPASTPDNCSVQAGGTSSTQSMFSNTAVVARIPSSASSSNLSALSFARVDELFAQQSSQVKATRPSGLSADQFMFSNLRVSSVSGGQMMTLLIVKHQAVGSESVGYRVFKMSF